MRFVGIDLHTNRFTCCYLVDNSTVKQTKTFDLDTEGLKRFYATINKDTYVLVEATVNSFSNGRVPVVFIKGKYCFFSKRAYSRLTFLIDV